MDKDNNMVANKIKSIRQSKGLNQEEFGEQVGNAHKTLVSKWEKGQNLPNSERLKRIAELGNISVDELLYGNHEDRIKKMLLQKKDEEEFSVYEEYVLNFFKNSKNKYPTEKEVIDVYDEIANSIDNVVKKTVAQRVLAFNIQHTMELLSSKEVNDQTLQIAINELKEASTNYETCFNKSVEVVYKELLDSLH